MTAEIRTVRDLYLWCISVIYLFAFTSLFVQIPGLYGDNGILPAKLVLEKEAESFHDLIARQPTLLRLLPSIGFDVQTGMDFLCLGGALLSFVAMVSRDQRNCIVFAVLWMFYLSLFHVGQTFLWFHWDVLLLEAGFVTILVAPLNFFGLHDAIWHHCHDGIAMQLVRWLLFRLTFACGIAKLTSASESWWNLTAMQHYYETQFLPTPLAWYFHQLPEWVQRLSAVAAITAEIIGALLMLSPVKGQRLVAFYSQVLLMTLAMLTGNYGFCPLLTLTLCLSLIDDTWLNSWTGSGLTYKGESVEQSGAADGWKRLAKLAFCTKTSLSIIYAVVCCFTLRISTDPPSIQSAIAFSAADVQTFVYYVAPLSALVAGVLLTREIINATTRSLSYKQFKTSRRLTELVGCLVVGLAAAGVFFISLVPHLAVDSQLKSTLPQVLQNVQSWTTNNYRLTSPYFFHRRYLEEEEGRVEVILEGSDRIDSAWKEYNFRFKPGDISDRLPIVAPHQPRLDYQMWFAARGHYSHNHWLLNLVYRLLTQQHEVLELMGENPFPDDPPKFIRASLYKYHFTSTDKNDETRYSDTDWWTRERVGDYLPVLSLDEPSFIDYIQAAGIHLDVDAAEKTEPRLLRGVVGWLRSVLGQGNDSGSSICLVLVITGFLLTLFDPSIAIFSSQPFVDGAAVCSS